MKLNKIVQWLALLAMLNVLAACGGGSSGEPSNLLSSVETTPGGGTTTPSQPVDVSFLIEAVQIVPTAGSTTVTVTTFASNPGAEQTDEFGRSYVDFTRLVTRGGVTLSISLTGDAYFLENGRTQLDVTSDQRGQVAFNVAHVGNGNVLVTIQGRSNYTGGGSYPLYFGGSVTAEVLENITQIIADGTTQAQIIISARDAFLSPIPGLEVKLNFSPDAQAVVNSETAFITNAAGQFKAGISNSIAQQVSVIPQVGRTAAQTIKLNFTKSAQQNAVISATLATPGIIPADGESAAKLIVLARSPEGVPLSGLAVSLAFAADSFAVASPASGNTDESGQFTTNIVNFVTQATSVTPIVGGTAARPIELNFGTSSATANLSVTATLLNQNRIPANGVTTAKLMILARDLNGIAVEGLPVAIAFPRESFAVATQSMGQTNANGQFLTEVSNSVPETVSIVAIVGGVRSNPVTMEFIASGAGETPTDLDIRLNRASAAANGSDTVQLTVVARDRFGNVVPNVPVRLSGGSATSLMRVVGSNGTGSLYVSGNTGEQGMQVTITSSTEQTLNLSASAVVEGNAITSPNQSVIFTRLATPESPDLIAEVTLEALNTEQIADGKSAITLSGRAVTAAGNPVANASVTFERRGNAVIAMDNQGKTYADGRFFATVTNSNVESFSIRAIIDGISSVPLILNFTPLTDGTGTVIIPPTAPTTVHLIASPQTQIANGVEKITLTAMVLDSSRTPMPGVQVSLSTLPGPISNSTLFDKARDVTGGAGSSAFEITNTRSGSVTVVATAQGLDSSDKASGATATANIVLNFVDSISATQLSLVSNPNSAVADGISTITVDVIARDSNGVTVADVPINIILGDFSARATPSTGATDANGVFSTQITSRQVGSLGVTAQIRDMNVSRSLDLQFTSASSSQDVTKLVISQFSDNEQLANGQDKVTIQVSALNDRGTPVSNVPIELITSADFPVSFSQLRGVTAEDGVFTTEVSSIEVGILSITAQAPDTAASIRSETIAVTFNAPAQSASPATVSLIIENNNQPADGKSVIIITAKVLDERGRAVIGVPVELISSNPNLDPDDGSTNGLGEWRTTITSELVTSATITAVTAGTVVKQSTAQNINFIAVAAPPPPASLLLNTSTSTSPVSEDVVIISSAKDINGVPMEGVNVAYEIISGAVIFRSAASGVTDAGGIFSATVSSTEAGVVELRATAANRAISSNPISITFERGTDAQIPVASIELFASNQTIESEGKTEGIIISARVKDANNNILVGKAVNFAVDSGDIQPVSRVATSDSVEFSHGETNGISDNSGQAYARLTTIGNPNNRIITITARSETVSAIPLEIQVVGSKLQIEGRKTVVLDPINPLQNNTQLTILLRNSADKGIAGKTLTIHSSQGHALSATQVVTDANGQAQVTITPDPSKIGEDTITVQKIKETTTEIELVTTHKWLISDENFTLTYNGTVSSSGLIEIPIGGDTTSGGGTGGGTGLPCVNTSDPNCNIGDTGGSNGPNERSFTVRWLQGNMPKTGERVTISTTRGSISNLVPADGILDNNGELKFTISSNDVGEAVITAYADAGPSATITVYFVAVTAHLIELQTNRPVINPNNVGSSTEQSVLVATVWDVNRNLVKNKTIDFRLTDVTGGILTQSRAITDSNGQARTVYIAGPNSSAANGVEIVARVIEDDITPAILKITVAQRSLFIDIGSGNTLVDEDGLRYETFHTVLVTDSNGTPVNGVNVTLSIYPTYYLKWGKRMC
jgi:adhesin/invasin